MKKLNFNSYCDFSIEAFNRLLKNDFEDSINMAIIAKYNGAKEVIKNLLSVGLDLKSIEIYDEYFNGYCDEYIISVYIEPESDPEVWCKPMRRKNGYLKDDSEFIYVLDNCSSKVLKYLKSEHIYEVSICDDEELCDDDCENCELNECNSDSNTTYVINGKQVDKDVYLKELERFEDRYTELIRKSISDFSEFMEEMNEFRKLFSW